MRINKIICDKCKKEIEKGKEIRIEFKRKEETANGYSKGFIKFKEYEICEECLKNMKFVKNV